MNLMMDYIANSMDPDQIACRSSLITDQDSYCLIFNCQTQFTTGLLVGGSRDPACSQFIS